MVYTVSRYSGAHFSIKSREVFGFFTRVASDFKNKDNRERKQAKINNSALGFLGSHSVQPFCNSPRTGLVKFLRQVKFGRANWMEENGLNGESKDHQVLKKIPPLISLKLLVRKTKPKVIILCSILYLQIFIKSLTLSRCIPH